MENVNNNRRYLAMYISSSMRFSLFVVHCFRKFNFRREIKMLRDSFENVLFNELFNRLYK